MVKGLLHHIELNVSNLNKSIEFWGWLLEELGYHSHQKWDRGQSWKLGDTYIVFVQTEEQFLNRQYHRCCTGINHLAFHAESREQVDIVRNKLIEKDITILYTDKYPFAGGEGHYAVYFEDPDRVKVELVSPI
ncbi:VOC family protein [Mangrovibacillus sp. Mu-81]|jgi:catechol 2,3-dioxygenase-like lactoylglutathione lyase family enzyme|uniref:VOC family protein n=1 Tax=Mangrovibacillus sp. Mu-81 TaxID=3121478 RepID=UPI002FE4CD27